MRITTGKIKSAQKIVVYGPEGIGKSTFASHFPGAVFIDTEGSTKNLDVARFDRPTSWEMLLEQVEYIRQGKADCRTLVIDTADWAERLAAQMICARAKKNGIEDFGYGKGYTYLAEEFGKLLNRLEDVVERGINIVVTAHAKMNKIEQPDETGAYDRWELKLTKQCAPMLKEWADMLLFANYKTLVVKTDDKKYKGKGGTERVMYATHTAVWDAKNRHGLPDMMPFEYSEIGRFIGKEEIRKAPSAAAEQQAEPPAVPVPAKEAPPPAKPDPLDELVDDMKDADIPVNDAPKMPKTPDIPEYVPKALADLMKANGVTLQNVEEAVARRGIFPPGTPYTAYPPDFVEGVLISAWNQMYDFMISEGIADLPF